MQQNPISGPQAFGSKYPLHYHSDKIKDMKVNVIATKDLLTFYSHLAQSKFIDRLKLSFCWWTWIVNFLNEIPKYFLKCFCTFNQISPMSSFYKIVQKKKCIFWHFRSLQMKASTHCKKSNHQPVFVIGWVNSNSGRMFKPHFMICWERNNRKLPSTFILVIYILIR